ncbi:hypothetical protein K0M31_018977 [Melipona bicolor]|uniref:Uncharacterized protein n=1 Tax=Melipona bicolor TaxID=60889 RepID=A0AA40FCL1_9HYME|nr:hypothetical protein K0M31_018977 [Melipona bicolor]
MCDKAASVLSKFVTVAVTATITAVAATAVVATTARGRCVSRMPIVLTVLTRSFPGEKTGRSRNSSSLLTFLSFLSFFFFLFFSFLRFFVTYPDHDSRSLFTGVTIHTVCV